MRDRRSLGVVCGDEGARSDREMGGQGLGRGKGASAKVWPRFSRSRARRLPSPTRGHLSPSNTDNGLQVNIDIVHLRLTFTHHGSSTNARFIESLDSTYQPIIDRVHESRKDTSDDEDEDALFAELEAELENADSAALRDGGIKEMQAQLRRSSSILELLS